MSDPYESIVRTGPGTPMGELMRQFWIPAALSKELEADAPPVRLMLLGEKLIAFRDSSGKVGIMDHRCPHRCASLFYGRVEENGIRCVYHGWKYDAEGNCVDQANIPARQQFTDKIHTKAYLTAERNGLIWVFMGDRTKAPELPPFEVCSLPESKIDYRFVQRRCNWLQAVEGDLDTSHVGFLHFGAAKPSARLDREHQDIVVNRAPEYKVAEVPYGLTYGAHRPSPTVPGGTYWRTAHYLFPFWIMPPVASLELNIMVRAFVPMDDDHCMFVGIEPKGYIKENNQPGAFLKDNLHPNTTDWYGRYRMVEAEENDYLIDREEQREKSYTGIQSIHTQDQCVTESMGEIVDRSFENLAPSDIAIARNRRMLQNTVKAFTEGKRPASADDPSLLTHIRGGYYTTTEPGDWLKLHREEVQKLVKQSATAIA